MSKIVQAFDPNQRAYVAIDVASGDIIGKQATPFTNKVTGEPLEEIEPLERIRPEPVTQSDPLGTFR